MAIAPDDLHRRVKTAAASEGLTLKAYLEAALVAAAERSEAATKATPPRARKRDPR